MSLSSTAIPQSPNLAVALRATVVIPCFNEADALPHLFERLAELEETAGDSLRLTFLFVDDCSSDDTPQIIGERADFRDNYNVIQHARNRGVTAAIMTGLRASQDEVVCSIDADATYDPFYLLDMIPLLTDDVDLVTASPHHPDGAVVGVPSWRVLLSRGASRIYGTLLRNKIHTCTSCCRVHRRSTCLEISEPRDGFVGVAEMLLSIDRRGGRVVECPARLTIRQYGQSKMRTFSVLRQHLSLLSSCVVRRAIGSDAMVSKRSQDNDGLLRQSECNAKN